MSGLLFHLKGQATILNGLFFLIILVLIFRRYKKNKTANVLAAITVIIFLLSSTAYLPDHLTRKLERQYPALNSAAAVNIKGKVYVHVLGSGYSNDKSVPATSQIGPAATGRVIEGIRVFKMFDSAVLVTSGNAMHAINEATQAQVTKNAAIVLGVPAYKIETLDTPSTTKEEAQAFVDKFGRGASVIVVTDAMHMPRAIKMFKAAGLSPIAAPTNYKVPDLNFDGAFAWWPALKNITLTDLLLHEYLGSIKAAL